MEYDFQFIGTAIPVTIYKTGIVRFSWQAVEEFGLANSKLCWGIDAKNHMLAFKIDEKGRRVNANSFKTSCPLEIARQFVGKFSIKKSGDTFILRKIPT